MAEMENASTMSSEEDLEQEEELTELSSSVPSPCLFCTQQCMPAEELLQHCVRDHGIDLRLLQRQLSESEGTSAHVITCPSRAGLDFYSWTKLINYLRSEVEELRNTCFILR